MDSLTLDDLYLEFNTSYFPPTQRERIRKKLEAAGKLQSNYLSPLEVIQEKFGHEAHILNKTVIVDDGTERKVYSTCVFENVKRYNCHVCVTAVFGKTFLIQHNCSRHHYDMLQKTTYPHQNFDENQFVDLDSSLKKLSMSDTQIKTELLDRCKEQVFIGLEYLVEVAYPRNPYLFCLLCNKESEDVCCVMDHLQSIEHRMYYLLLYFPKVYKKLLMLKKYIRKQEISKVVYEIEKKLGRLRPWHHDGALSLKEKRAIRHSIDCGPHLRDGIDFSFAEDIPFTEEFKDEGNCDTVFTEFVVNESEDSVIENYTRLKGGVLRCRLCKMNMMSPLETITHPYTGRHLEKTVKAIDLYESMTCQIKSVLDDFPQPLIGTEYIVEYDEQGVLEYHCMLCSKTMNNPGMATSHLVSKSHRQRYIHHHMPKKNEELLKQSGPVRADEIEKLIKLIEAKFGRLPPFGCILSLKHKVDSQRTMKDIIKGKIMDGKHFTLDDYGMPKEVYKMPVPLFPREGQEKIEVPTKKRAKRKRKKSESSSSSESLTPAARMRGLSPEPDPHTSRLPDEVMMRPTAVVDWLQKVPTTTAPGLVGNPCEKVVSTPEMRERFALLCDEDNWETRGDHGCEPILSSWVDFQKAVDENTYRNFRKKLTFVFLREKLTERGWAFEDLDPRNEKIKTMITIMIEGPLCRQVCRPLCAKLVHSMRDVILEEFEEAKIISEDEVLICAKGLCNISNMMDYVFNLPSYRV